MRFSRQECWSGLPCSLPEDLPNSGIKPISLASPALQAVSLPTEPPGKPISILLLQLSRFSRVRPCATPLTAAHQAPPSLGFSRQEHWSGLPFPSPMHESEKWKLICSVMSDSSATPWTVAYQAPPSMGFSRQEYWSGLPFPSPISILRTPKPCSHYPMVSECGEANLQICLLTTFIRHVTGLLSTAYCLLNAWFLQSCRAP